MTTRSSRILFASGSAASGFKPWWFLLRLWWALAWRYTGAAWLLCGVLGFFLMFENQTAIWVVVSAGIIGLLILLGWCGSEVFAILQPLPEPGLRFEDQRVFQPLDVRATACVLLAAVGLAVFVALSFPIMNLDGGFAEGTFAFVFKVGDLLDEEFLKSMLFGYLEFGYFELFNSDYAFYLNQGMIMAVMFLAWSGGLMRKPIDSGTRALALLATLLVFVIIIWAMANAMRGDENLMRVLSLQGTFAALGLGIGLLGLWWRRRPSFWRALAISWLVFAWVWIAPLAPFAD